MPYHKITFGTDGWRAPLDTLFTEENVIRVAEAFVRFLQSKKQTSNRIAVGYDGRRNSKEFALLFGRILSFHGIDVLLSESVIPTPVLSFAVQKHSCAAGVMITASHNPPSDNGIKFKGSYGGPFMSEQTSDVERLLTETVNGRQDDQRIHMTDLLPGYLERIDTLIDGAALRTYASQPSHNASVIIDSMGGAGGTIIEDFLIPLGWRAQTIFGTPEPTFYDRLPEPIEKNLGPLLYNTAATDALLGIATDGDADRCSIVYHDGTWMSAQENILALLWHLHVNKQWNGAVIKSASVTDKVRMLAHGWGEKVFDVSVGFKYITDVMLKEDVMLGAEESGGFGYKYHIPERDGILSGLMFCEMIAKSGKSLRQIMNEITGIVGPLHYDRIDARYEKPDREEILPRLSKYSQNDAIGGFPVQSVRTFREGETLTGVKFILGNSRWLLIRTSQTEPLVRIYAEGQQHDEVEVLLREGKNMVGL
jgi:phosphomannomutase